MTIYLLIESTEVASGRVQMPEGVKMKRTKWTDEKIINALENDHRLYYKIKNEEEAHAITSLLLDKGYTDSNEVYSENNNCLILIRYDTGRKVHFLVRENVAVSVGSREYKPIETIVNPTYDDLEPIFSDVEPKEIEDLAEEYDTVERPKHYNVFEREVIYVIKDLLDNNENYTRFESYCIGNGLKYFFRAGMKNDFCEDIEKGKWYLDKILEGRES